jgi:tetratricopeptide (TPR) repeat protein
MNQARVLRIWLVSAAWLAVRATMAQPPPGDQFVNMQEISSALRVSCNYCHTAERGSGAPEPKKEIARAMIAMTRDLNAKIATFVGEPAGSLTRVQCIACHRGVAIPRQLGDILSQTLREQGTGAAIAQYRDLRQRYFGRQAYDFGEDTLLTLAQRIVESKPDDALALIQLNLEFNPRSARSYFALAHAYTRKIDDASAIASLEKALEIDPDNNIARGQLEQLKSYRRRK